MRQLLAIAWKDTYLRFSDRTLLVIMILTPIVLSTIIGLAFGGGGGGQITFSDIPLVIVNLDEGAESGGQFVNMGEFFTQVFLPNADSDLPQSDTSQCGTSENSSADFQQSLSDLFTTTQLTDIDAARAGVEDGTYVAAIIIPADFSAKMSPSITDDGATVAGAQVEVYANDGSAIQASIVRSVSTSILDQFAAGSVTIAVTVSEMIQIAQDGNLALAGSMIVNGVTGDTSSWDFTCAFIPGENIISINQQPLDEVQEQSAFVIIMIVIGSAQGAYFALFTAQFGILDLFNEKETGTLQRMMVTPTPRSTIILGKLFGVLLSVLLQIALLLGSFTVIASLVEGQPLFIWGNSPLQLVLLVLMTVLAICGISLIIAGVATSPEQARVVGPLINAGLGALSGAFGFQLPPDIARLSPIYWSVNGFQTLAGGNAIWLNLLALLILGLLTSALGLWLFNRKVEV